MNKKIIFGIILTLVIISGIIIFLSFNQKEQIKDISNPGSITKTVGTGKINQITEVKQIEQKIEQDKQIQIEERKKKEEIMKNIPIVTDTKLNDTSFNPSSYFKNEKLLKFFKDNKIEFETFDLTIAGKKTTGFSVGRNESSKFGNYQGELIGLINQVGMVSPLKELEIYGKAKILLDNDGETIIKIEKIEIGKDGNKTYTPAEISSMKTNNIYELLLP